MFLNLILGVSVGRVDLYGKIFKRAIESIAELKSNKNSCLLDDQGIIAWLYGKENFPLSLDFNSYLFATSQFKQLRGQKFNDLVGGWEKVATNHIPAIIHFAGSKRAYRAYYRKIKKWHTNRLADLELKGRDIPRSERDRIGSSAIFEFLRNSSIMVDHKETPYFEVCPEAQGYSWNHALKDMVRGFDDVLKYAGISPQHPPPEGCPADICHAGIIFKTFLS
jgi:lipopolysaccharide biosynthesis glycosyltransferase